ncbi:glycoside hydrolase family 2 protein [Urechidicola croceus]|uniref:Beta-glucuronidase n=1 Tax=Urechidicola croceus TaxID=1850246 RepID=A0A1D8PBN3_9FLAO|nr:glycoside hydrolase family 2 [Urechidicola croceus]AOW21970.1 glycoside hydrolase family 2 [Urechidicola croceus]
MNNKLFTKIKSIAFLVTLFFCCTSLYSQSAMTNVESRNTTNLNGDWTVIIDPTGTGDWRQVWKEKKPEKKTDFYEYSFEGSPTMKVPGDFNSQMVEITYLEGIVWYKKEFTHTTKSNKRNFIHFGAVNYVADVYLNGEHIGSHEGGFTPFQFEITDKIKSGKNALVVKVNNKRLKNGLPSLGFDWFNYGGITRDVNLIETSKCYIEDYHIQLEKHSDNEVLGWVQLNGVSKSEKVKIKIPELNIEYETISNKNGLAEVKFSGEFELWSPQNPKLYSVIIKSKNDEVTDEIGFRTIEIKGKEVLLNNKPIFFKSVNIHEENPYKAAKAYSEEDALILLNWAKELGCNMVRLAHYPHSEHMVKLAEKMGLMVWSELPVYQHIEFSNPDVPQKMDLMMKEMIRRDRNRAAVVLWSLSNETYSFTENRDNALIELTKQCKLLDDTRLITHVINNQGYDNNTFNVWDTLYNHVDIIALNEYLGWYVPWQGKPSETKWKFVNDKPVFISEFGGESLYGSNYGPKDEAASWSEEYQEKIYQDQIEMFNNVPNLIGVCPWILVDYRSSGRMHPVYQKGYNRKGLISENGEKKKSWYIMKEYFQTENN